MSGAQAYTTSRGKNKKRKEGVRKDNKNNGERKLKTKAKDHSGFSGPKEPVGIVAGHLMGGGATGVSSVHTRIKENPQAALKALREKCFYSTCSKTAGELGVILKECSVCRKVKYCSRECQVNDWKAGHGKVCKILKDGGKPLAIAEPQQAHDSSSSDEDEDDDDEEGEDDDDGDDDIDGDGDGDGDDGDGDGDENNEEAGDNVGAAASQEGLEVAGAVPTNNKQSASSTEGELQKVADSAEG